MTNTGHYCISLSRSLDCPRLPENRLFFTSPVSGVDPDCEKKVLKLHKQYAHPDSDKFKKFLSRAGHQDDVKLLEMVDSVTNSCLTCKRYKKAPLTPAVGLPLATMFNETVAMDLKFICGQPILHMIDHVTRYSCATVIANKRKETVVQAILEYWVRIFGAPAKFLTDNGGEFVNKELIEFAEKFI